jgi:hypothetical protein
VLISYQSARAPNYQKKNTKGSPKLFAAHPPPLSSPPPPPCSPTHSASRASERQLIRRKKKKEGKPTEAGATTARPPPPPLLHSEWNPRGLPPPPPSPPPPRVPADLLRRALLRCASYSFPSLLLPAPCPCCYRSVRRRRRVRACRSGSESSAWNAGSRRGEGDAVFVGAARSEAACSTVRLP